MWLGDATGSPATRFIQSVVPYYRADGVLLAASYADVVDGALLVPLRVSDLGAVVALDWPERRRRHELDAEQ